MAIDLNAKAAYIRGLMNGMEFDAASKDGKVIAAMMDLLEAMAATVAEHDEALDQLGEEVDLLNEDMDELVGALYGEDETDGEGADEEEQDAVYEVTCPNCNTVTTVDEDTLLREELVCPNCGAAFDIELEPEEEAAPDPIFVMPADDSGE